MQKKKRNDEIIKLANKGFTLESIGLKFKISKQRVRQLLAGHNVIPLKVRQQQRNEILRNIPLDLYNGMSVIKVREKYKLKSYEIKQLYKNGIDVRLIKKDVLKKEYMLCDKLYKKGLTAYEIINVLPKTKNVNRVYSNVCKVNDGHLPKRINTRIKKSMKLKNKILNLKINKTFEEVHAKLVSQGVKNLNGGELRLETVIKHYYDALK